MEWIGIGIMIAIGWYLMPVVVATVFVVASIIFVLFCKLLGGCRDENSEAIKE